MVSKLVGLTSKGRSAWTVALPRQAGRVEKFAAQELTKYIHQISGARLRPAGKAAKTRLIRIGLRDHLKSARGLPPAKPGFDGYSIHVSPQSIVIAGDNPRGVLYGVYDLLERLGCRWYHPTLDPNDPEVVPRNADLSLPAAAWSESARVEWRWYNGSAFFFGVVPERILPQIDWAAKNRFSGVSWQAHHAPGSVGKEMQDMHDCGALDALTDRGLMLHGPGHCFPFFLSTEEYYERHPEWFGLGDGKRRKHGGEWPATNYCWSNAEANEQFIRNVEKFLAQWPQLSVLMPVWIDGGQVCQCPECQKRGGANLIVDLFNLISDRLAESCPNVTLESVLGYPPIEDVPQGAQSNGKWQGIYAHWGRNHKQSYNDPCYARKANMLTWASYFPGKFEICSYYAASSHETPHSPPFLHALEGDTEFLINHGVKGHFVLHYPHGFWWNFSFNMKMGALYPYYHPSRKPREELRDYALNYFGPLAGPLIDDYFEMMGSVGDHNLEVSYRASWGEATDEDMAWLREQDKLLARAAYLVRDDKLVSYRVGKLRAGLKLLMLWGQGQKVRKDAEAAFQIYETSGETARELAEESIVKARAYCANVQARAEELEKQFPGAVAADWLKSWCLDRTITSSLDACEKKMKGQQPAGPSAKPGHVAAIDA